MNEQALWNLFMTTGLPEVYLTLRQQQEEQEKTLTQPKPECGSGEKNLPT